MRKTKVGLTLILLGFFAINLIGTNKSEVYDCYITNRMPVWKSVIDQLSSHSEKDSDSLLELINYQYGYIGWCLENNQKDEAIVYLKLAEENVKLLEGINFQRSLVSAYRSAFYGFHIAISKFSAPLIGPKSAECARKAVMLDPNQPFAYIQLGNVKFHSPAIMGGSKSEALSYYLKAKTLMEKKSGELHGDWNYLCLLITISKAYESVNNLLKAKLLYEEILRFEPRISWVRNDLYPKLLKRL